MCRKVRARNAIKVLLTALAILALAGCGNTNSEADSRDGSLPAKGYSVSYEAVDEALNHLRTAQSVCSELVDAAVEDRVELLRKAHSDVATGWTDTQWPELELAYLAACYERGLWPYGTAVNMDVTALSSMISADADTPNYCRALEGLSDDESQALLQETHTGPLYVSLAEVEADRIAMQLAYLVACQDLGIWGK